MLCEINNCSSYTAETWFGSLSWKSFLCRRVCLSWGYVWHPTELLSSCQYGSGKFFDQRSGFSRLACKFAFSFHFLGLIFSVLVLAFSYPSQLSQWDAPCTVSFAEQEKIAFIYSQLK